MHHRRPAARCVVAVVVLLAVLAGGLPPAAADDLPVVRHAPPVDAVVVDRFDLPPHPWQPGNRGIDYATAPGAPVAASAAGEVVFAGDVAGALHVTVRHADGLRTSYSFLAEVRVARGQRVEAGQVLGTAGGPVHFGVRAPDDTYLDPEALLAGTLEPRVRLVPGAEEGVDPLRERRSLLDTVLGTGFAAAAFLAERVPPAVELAVRYAVELHPATHLDRLLDAAWDQVRLRLDCTAASTPPPPPAQRRIVVLVAGLGTNSDGNSAWNIDTDALGYAPEDVVRFSYAGGRAPDPSPPTALDEVDASRGGRDPRAGSTLRDIPQHAYDAEDSQQHLEVSGDRLGDLLRAVERAEPGVPIDVVAHSQGGVVARLGVVRAGASGTLPGTVENLVTLGSPHQGAPLATAVEGLHLTDTGRDVLAWVRDDDPVDDVAELDDRLPAIGELAETSHVLADMRGADIPDGVRFTTIGVAGDLVVPGRASADAKADRNVRVLTAPALGAHGELTERADVTREVALAVAGAPPTCTHELAALGSFVVGDVVHTVETVLGLDATGSGVAGDVVRSTR